MSKNITTISFEIPGYSEQYISLHSEQSLLDYDVIIFRPDMTGKRSSRTRVKKAFGQKKPSRLEIS